MHAVFDSESLRKQAVGLVREKQEDDRLNWVAEQKANMVLLDEHDLSPANADRQLGKQYTTAEFETRLRRINPNLHFEDSPNPTKKRLYFLKSGKKDFLCLYERGLMPEHSIMQTVYEDIPDPFLIDNPAKGLDRKDLPAFEQTAGTEENPIGEIKWKDPEAPKPGTIRVKRAGREVTRGWRTVLMTIVWHGAASVTAVENMFGSDNRPEWATKLGKQKIITQL